MRHPRTSVAVPAAIAALLMTGAAACADDPADTATDPAPAVDELAAHDGRPCPSRLPGTGDEAFGTSDPAGSAPELAGPDRAWVCTYGLRDGPQGPAWTRGSHPQPVAAERLPALAAGLAELAPADPGRICTDELGPRYLVVLATDADLTGVAVDGYGCRDVRLTDDPYATPPGEASTPGVTPGVLASPGDLVEALATGGLVAGR